MPHIVIISGSVREGRMSHRVALYFQQFIAENKLGTSKLLDLKAYNFPLFEERIRYQKSPAADVLSFQEKLNEADGVLLVTPEYNGGYPAAVKNVVDLFYEEWHRKPIAISTVSGGDFAGTQVITSLLFTLWKIRAWVVPAMFPVPKVQDHYTETGEAIEKEVIDKRAKTFVNELLWCIEAGKRMNLPETPSA